MQKDVISIDNVKMIIIDNISCIDYCGTSDTGDIYRYDIKMNNGDIIRINLDESNLGTFHRLFSPIININTDDF